MKFVGFLWAIRIRSYSRENYLSKFLDGKVHIFMSRRATVVLSFNIIMEHNRHNRNTYVALMCFSKKWGSCTRSTRPSRNTSPDSLWRRWRTESLLRSTWKTFWHRPSGCNAVDDDQRKPRIPQISKEDWTGRKDVRGGRRLGSREKKDKEMKDERDGEILKGNESHKDRIAEDKYELSSSSSSQFVQISS